MRPTHNIGYLLQHLSSVLAKQSDQVLQEQLGLGLSQFKILMALQWNPHTQQRQIAETLGQTEASVSRQIKLMIRRGLLSSTVSPDNRREHLTTPTTKGIKLTEVALGLLNRYHAPTFGVLTDKQKAQLAEILVTIHRQACQPGRLAACDHPLSLET